MMFEENNNNRIPRKERERLRLREEILQAAMELFSEKTFEKTSMQQIAERAEVSVGRLYNLFEGKKNIFQELVVHIFEVIEETGRRTMALTDDPVEKIRLLFRTYLDFSTEKRHAITVIFNENPLKMKGLIKQFVDRQTEKMTSLFADAIERGAIRREDPRLLAFIYHGIFHGIVDELAMGGTNHPKEYYQGVFERLFLAPLTINAPEKES